MKLADRLKTVWDNDELMFKVGTGLKFLMVSLLCTLSVLLFIYLFIRIDLIFFVANGFPGVEQFEDAFYGFIYSSLYDGMLYLCIASIFIFTIGFYLSYVMIRPFKKIGEYCEDQMQGKKKILSPDIIPNHKLLISFSVFFFSRINEIKNNGKLEKVEIPIHFTKVHKPNYEVNFLFNYLFLTVIFALLSSIAIFELSNEIRESIFELSRKFLINNHQAEYFLERQFEITNIAVNFFITLHLILYLLLGFHLYSKVSAPAFAVFATMRSFLKGNYHNRIHLIGYYYLRDDCRKINKYLDHIQKNLT
jgi:uncharacterized protein YggT (Ycf19 family)